MTESSGAPKDGEMVRVRVLSVSSGNRMEVSLRPSRLSDGVSAQEAVAEDPLPQEGDVVRGYVVKTDTKGCFIRLSRKVMGRALLKVRKAGRQAGGGHGAAATTCS